MMFNPIIFGPAHRYLFVWGFFCSYIYIVGVWLDIPIQIEKHSGSFSLSTHTAQITPSTWPPLSSSKLFLIFTLSFPEKPHKTRRKSAFWNSSSDWNKGKITSLVLHLAPPAYMPRRFAFSKAVWCCWEACPGSCISLKSHFLSRGWLCFVFCFGSEQIVSGCRIFHLSWSSSILWLSTPGCCIAQLTMSTLRNGPDCQRICCLLSPTLCHPAMGGACISFSHL